MQIMMKRIYSPYDEQDGIRILVDRLWPRGIKKEDAKIDLWPKAITPSNELRKWYCHDEKNWPKFERRYQAEIRLQPEILDELKQLAKQEKITLLTASKHEQYNHVIVLKALLEE